VGVTGFVTMRTPRDSQIGLSMGFRECEQCEE
jgi:hypothetical protein